MISNWRESINYWPQLLLTEVHCHISCQGHSSTCCSQPLTECNKDTKGVPSLENSWLWSALAQEPPNGIAKLLRTAQQSQVLPPSLSSFPPSITGGQTASQSAISPSLSVPSLFSLPGISLTNPLQFLPVLVSALQRTPTIPTSTCRHCYRKCWKYASE